MLILGCGNFDRADDAAGLLVIRKLRELGINAHEHTGDSLALIEAWTGESEVVVIDTIVSGAAPGQVRSWDARSARLAAGEFRCSTHDLGLAEAVELARTLGRLPEQLTLYGIEGACFTRGAPPSPEVSAAADRLARQLAGR